MWGLIRVCEGDGRKRNAQERRRRCEQRRQRGAAMRVLYPKGKPARNIAYDADASGNDVRAGERTGEASDSPEEASESQGLQRSRAKGLLIGEKICKCSSGDYRRTLQSQHSYDSTFYAAQPNSMHDFTIWFWTSVGTTSSKPYADTCIITDGTLLFWGLSCASRSSFIADTSSSIVISPLPSNSCYSTVDRLSCTTCSSLTSGSRISGL